MYRVFYNFSQAFQPPRCHQNPCYKNVSYKHFHDAVNISYSFQPIRDCGGLRSGQNLVVVAAFPTASSSNPSHPQLVLRESRRSETTVQACELPLEGFRDRNSYTTEGRKRRRKTAGNGGRGLIKATTTYSTSKRHGFNTMKRR